MKSSKGRIHTLHLYDPANLFKHPSVAYLSWNSLRNQAHERFSQIKENEAASPSKSHFYQTKVEPFYANLSERVDGESAEMNNSQPMKQRRVEAEKIVDSMIELAELLDNVNDYMKYITQLAQL